MRIVKNRTRLAEQAGIGLLEILVAVLVISVGLLSFLAMQMLSLEADRSAYLRTQALLIGVDASERVRANPQGFESGAYGSAETEEGSECYSAGACTGAELAQAEVAELRERVRQQLPRGELQVCLDSTPNDGTPTATACDGSGRALAVKVWWDEDQDGTAETLVAIGVTPR